MKCGCGPSELKGARRRRRESVREPVLCARNTQLPERLWVFVLQTLGPKAEFEGRDGPLGKRANVRPRQRWWLSTYIKQKVDGSSDDLQDAPE